MATGLEVIGVIANIVQLIDGARTLYTALEQFHSNKEGIPLMLREVVDTLSLLRSIFKSIETRLQDGSIASEPSLDTTLAGCKQDIEILTGILKKLLPNSTDSMADKSVKAIKTLAKKTKIEEMRDSLGRRQSALSLYVVTSLNTKEILKSIRRWLDAPDPSFNYNRAVKLRQSDTGIWLLEDDRFRNWKASPGSFIWLYGIPGCGKTILCTTALQDVMNHCQNNQNTRVAYFYFDFTDSQKQDPERMVLSLISQLAEQSVHPSLDAMYRKCSGGSLRPSLDDALEVLRNLVEDFPETYLVLDALDECSSRFELLDIIKQMKAWGLPQLRVLCTSRKEPDIEDMMSQVTDEKARVYLQTRVVNEDIKRYVQHCLQTDPQLARWKKDPSVQADIEDTLARKADGMFRWAVCQLTEISKCRSKAALRTALATLPKTLDATYERILCSIEDADKDYAIRTLRLLVFSKTLNTVGQLAEMAAVDTGREPAFDQDEVLEEPLDVLGICTSLVTVASNFSQIDFGYLGFSPDMANDDEEEEDEEEDISSEMVVILAHYSVKEYLLSSRCSTGPASRFSMSSCGLHENMLQGCIDYLLQFEDTLAFQELMEETSDKARFASTADHAWLSEKQLHHGISISTIRKIIKLFSARGGALYDYIMYLGGHTASPQTNGCMPSPLYYASHHGLESVAELLLSEGAEVDAVAGEQGTALQAAVTGPYTSVIKMLLKHGADVNLKSGKCGTALSSACLGGSLEAARLLLDHGADVNVQDSTSGCPLQAALSHRYSELALLLLDHGADINMSCGEHGTAIQASFVRQYRENDVRLLLDRGADVNIVGGTYGTALQTAADYGRGLELLLSHGANVNTKAGIHGTALCAAALTDNVGYLQLLIEHGADVNAYSKPYGTALQAAASKRNNAESVKLLLKHGAKINATDDCRGSALDVARANENGSIVEILLIHQDDAQLRSQHH